MNSLAPNAEIRVKSTNGLKTYALTNEKGEAKFCYRCGFCNKTHQVWLPAYMSEQYKGVIFAQEGWQKVVAAHLRECRPIAFGELEEKVLINRINTYANYRPVLFNWVDRGDGGHKCSAKCQSACGQRCECQCRGRNHGR